MNAKPISENSTAKGCGTVGGILFCGIFLALGLFFFWVIVVQPLVLWTKAKSWPSVEAKITNSKIVENRDSDGTSYRASFTYAYQVNNRNFSNDRYGLIKVSGSRNRAKKHLERHPVGSQTTIYYDPSDPNESLMNRSLSWSLLLGLLPIVFIAVGGSGIWFIATGRGNAFVDQANAKMAKQKKLAAGLTPAIAGDQQVPVVLPDDLKDREFDKPLKLRPEHSRKVVLAVVGGVALFWNGLVGFFVFDFFGNQRIGLEMVLVSLFAMPFILIGLIMLGYWIYVFMTMFNPKVEIAMSNGAVPIGGEVDLAWEIIGNPNRIKNLKIQIEGSESATYRRGTSNYTDTETFLEIPVVETSTPDDIQFGSATISIPSSAMHSFDAGSNQVKWVVKVQGEIPLWPDVIEALSFRVTP